MITRSIVYQKSALCLLLIFIFLPAISVIAADSPEEVTINFNQPATEKISDEKLTLGGFAVAVVALP